MRVVNADSDIRTLIAKHLGVGVERVTDEVRFADLGADWLDRLELMIVIEAQFAGAKIANNDVDQIYVVGDLMRYVESVCKDRRRQSEVGR